MVNQNEKEVQLHNKNLYALLSKAWGLLLAL